jgi:hypothetical protein
MLGLAEMTFVAEPDWGKTQVTAAMLLVNWLKDDATRYVCFLEHIRLTEQYKSFHAIKSVEQ